MTKIDLINKQIEQINQTFLGRDSKFLDESARNLHELRDFYYLYFQYYYLYFQYGRDKKENFFNIEKEDLVADYKELNNWFWELELMHMVPEKLSRIFNAEMFN